MAKPSRGGEKYVRLPHYLLKCPAYRSLSVYGRCLLVELEQRYNGHNNGGITLSHREAQAALNCSNKPVPAAFRELEDKGFLKVTQRGSFHWKTRGDGSKGLRATEWTLTAHPIDLPIRDPMPETKDFMRWQPPKKPRHADSVPVDRPKRTMSEGMTRRQRTNGTPTAFDEVNKRSSDGTLKAGTYSIPDTLALAKAEADSSRGDPAAAVGALAHQVLLRVGIANA